MKIAHRWALVSLALTVPLHAHAVATINAVAYAFTDAGQQLQSSGNPSRLEASAISSGVGFAGTANSYVDLTTGKIGAVTTNVQVINGTPSSPYPQNTSAYASFEDYLHFRIPAATAATLTTVGFVFAYDGAVEGSPYSGGLNFQALVEQYQANAAAATINRQYQYNNGSYRLLSDSIDTFGSVTVTEAKTGVFQGTITLHGADPILRVFELLGTDGQADFSHTATFAFTSMPAGVTYSSDSGAFLSAVPAVPEPSIYSMNLGGLVVVALIAGRARRGSAARRCADRAI